MTKVALLAVHGMGDTPRDFADELIQGLRERLGPTRMADLHVESVYYQGVFQTNQERLWQDMSSQPLDMTKLRKFVLYGFSDAAALERNAEVKNSPYERVQQVIHDALGRAQGFVGADAPVVVVAQSLGGQVISNYLWDAQKAGGASRGVWKDRSPTGADAEEKFRRLRTLRFLYTTGCNIPIFLGGFPKSRIKPVATSTKGYDFQWKNYYDEDDVLGWPLRPLSDAYAGAIHTDKQISAGPWPINMTPLSHTHYWEDVDVLRPLSDDLRELGVGH